MARGDYADASYGDPKHFPMDVSSALNGTVAATEINRMTFMDNVTVTDWNIRCKTGGTEAGVRQVLICKSAAGTGTATAFGTQALGTMANGEIVDSACTATSFSAGDDLVIQHLGTGGGVYVIQPVVYYKSTFVS